MLNLSNIDLFIAGDTSIIEGLTMTEGQTMTADILVMKDVMTVQMLLNITNINVTTIHTPANSYKSNPMQEKLQTLLTTTLCFHFISLKFLLNQSSSHHTPYLCTYKVTSGDYPTPKAKILGRSCP